MRGLSVAEQGLRFIWDCFVKYQGTWAYLLLGALAVVLVLLYRKKEAAFLFLWYPLVLLLTVFNPFLMNRIIVKMDFESEFYRFFWLVPLPFLLAYILVESGMRLKKGWKRAVLLLAVGGLVLFWNRASLRQLATVSIPKNVYKVEDDLLAVSELIHRDSTEEEPKVAFPLEYNLQARQYDPSLHLTIERNKMLFWLGINTAGSYTDENVSYRYQSDIMDVIYGGQNTDPVTLRIALNRTRTDYLVAYKKNDIHETILAAGCEAIGETSDAVVYLTLFGKNHKE